tara:strand:+ start:187 stop:567 length:381 start_codon:yes stop_codon:yes gene_type:complete
MTKIKPGNWCPLIKKDCVELKCAWYCQVRGLNPQTGEEVDEWGCAITWAPMLMIENSQQQRATGAAVESFRNEVIRTSEENKRAYLDSVKQDPTNVTPINPVINLLSSDAGDIEVTGDDELEVTND